MRTPLSGILNVDKPPGWTSHDVVALVRRLTGQRRVGHAGTLDPLATGTLLVTVGHATRLSDYLMRSLKCYRASIRLGVRTATDDSEGEVLSTGSVETVTRERVVAALESFVGDVWQVPPTYSAIKHDGVPAYRLARQGRPREMLPRQVRIEAIALLATEIEVLDILVWCGAGTYIRALARDVGDLLGCRAHLTALRRLSSGGFAVDSAISVPELRALADAGRLADVLRPLDEALAGWPVVICNQADKLAILHGNAVTGPPHLSIAGSRCDGLGRLYGTDGELLALARYEDSLRAWHPYAVFASAQPRSVMGAAAGRTR